MNPVKFDEIVTANADRAVQQRINQFRTDLAQAFNKLVGKNCASDLVFRNSLKSYQGDESPITIIMNVLTGPTPTQGWPKALWIDERIKVKDNLLSQLDAVQQMILTAREQPQQDRVSQEGCS